MGSTDPTYTTTFHREVQAAIQGNYNSVTLNYEASEVIVPTPPIDILYGRPSRKKIFVSSKMAGDVLKAERTAAIRAIDAMDGSYAWAWERDGIAGCYDTFCLGHAKESDCFILILAEELRPFVQKEYRTAINASVLCFIFVKDDVVLAPATESFIKREKKNTPVIKFVNLAELETLITRTIREHETRVWRLQQMARQQQKAQRSRRKNGTKTV